MCTLSFESIAIDVHSPTLPTLSIMECDQDPPEFVEYMSEVCVAFQ